MNRKDTLLVGILAIKDELSRRAVLLELCEKWGIEPVWGDGLDFEETVHRLAQHSQNSIWDQLANTEGSDDGTA